MIILNHESFWGLFDETHGNYRLACIDIACPPKLIVTSAAGDQYLITLGEHAMQPDIFSFSDLTLPTVKIND